MKQTLCAAAACVAMMLSGGTTGATPQSIELQSVVSEYGLIQVAHKPKKQSTGSWKQHRDGHQGIARQKKEKKWHKKESTQGQKNFAPKRFRKLFERCP